jgi:hypothetical protein
MEFRFIAAALGAGAALFASAAQAQQAAAPPPPAIANPRYTTLVLEIDVNRPAAQVWARVGKYCDIAEWFRVTCAITSGKDGEVGAVRVLNGVTIEPLVGKTDLSYTYTQPVRTGVPFNAYHGTLEAKPVTARTSKLIYTFFYDTSMLADDAARTAELANRRGRFMTALQNMKILAEGGTLPPPPAPAR